MTNARRPGSYADTFHVAPGMPAGTLGNVRIKATARDCRWTYQQGQHTAAAKGH